MDPEKDCEEMNERDDPQDVQSESGASAALIPLQDVHLSFPRLVIQEGSMLERGILVRHLEHDQTLTDYLEKTYEDHVGKVKKMDSIMMCLYNAANKIVGHETTIAKLHVFISKIKSKCAREKQAAVGTVARCRSATTEQYRQTYDKLKRKMTSTQYKIKCLDFQFDKTCEEYSLREKLIEDVVAHLEMMLKEVAEELEKKRQTLHSLRRQTQEQSELHNSLGQATESETAEELEKKRQNLHSLRGQTQEQSELNSLGQATESEVKEESASNVDTTISNNQQKKEMHT